MQMDGDTSVTKIEGLFFCLFFKPRSCASPSSGRAAGERERPGPDDREAPVRLAGRVPAEGLPDPAEQNRRAPQPTPFGRY